MASPGSPPRGSRTSTVLLVVVALALCVGAAASLIASAATAPSYQPPPIQDLYLTGAQMGYIFLAAFLVIVGLLVWIWYDRRTAIPGRAALTGLMIVLVMLLLVALLQSGLNPGPSGPTLSSGNSTSSNSTGTSPHSNNTTVVVSSPGPNLGPLGFALPPWLLFVGVAAVALGVAAWLGPALWRRSQEPAARRRSARAHEVEQARGALATAARALDRGEEPREVVIRLYGALLARVAPLVGGVESDTPEEIRLTHLTNLGIQPGPAATLTHLFEEARYSSHPMGEDAADRAYEAIALARADLDRVRPEL